jgi:hypothetical protein
MKLQPVRKILLLVMAICIVFSVILTGILTAGYLDHDCTEGKIHPISLPANTEPDCPICKRIEIAKIFLKALKLASIVLFFAICSVFIIQTSNAHTAHDAYIFSPVALKVRFNT